MKCKMESAKYVNSKDAGYKMPVKGASCIRHPVSDIVFLF
ncbi:hypothetical protein C5S29_10310 [ANME-1 cluster archaeon GoMg3.2]|nr:hypothetical protein [ANME-1 cluster archaeon GoMg3.2]